MAINLSNVNISLNEFQRLSSGEFNAGEVKLAGETKLAKMNNHVGSFFGNKEIIAHEEVIAIKQALVRALSQNGVGQAELDKIRKDLGLATADVADRDLRHRSIMPLTRQQIREILDKNAAAINQFNAEHGGDVRIRMSTQLYGPGGMEETKAAKREALNAKLAEGGRRVNVNEDILHFQAIVANSIDFLGDAAGRRRVVELARAQLAALMQSCHGHPSPDEPATATFELPHGRTTSIAAGMSQKALAERLEDVIVRLTRRNLSNVEIDAVKAYQALGDDEARTAFLAALANDPYGGLKARALAVRCLYSRGVTDYASLAIANELDDHDALAFATALLALPKDATPEQIRDNPVFVAMVAKAPVKVPNGRQAYIPATSTTEYNKFVCESLRNNPETLLPDHRELAETARGLVRMRLGEVAMPDGLPIQELVRDMKMAGIDHGANPADWEAKRSSAEAIREGFLLAALTEGATRIVRAAAESSIRALGGNPENPGWLVDAMNARHPELFWRITEATTPANAQAIVEEFRGEIDNLARIYCKANPLLRGIREKTRQVVAEKLNVSTGAIGNEERGVIRRIGGVAEKLTKDILSGKVQASTDAEIEAAFKNLVDEKVAELMNRLESVDNLRPPLAPDVADRVKTAIFALQDFGNMDVARIAGEVGRRVDAGPLDELLRANGDKAAVQAELLKIRADIEAIMLDILAGKADIGPDDRDGICTVASLIAVAGRPGLADRLDAFFLRPDVKAEIEAHDDSRQETLVMDFFRETISFHPDVFAGGPWQAARTQTLFTAPRELAAFHAAGGEARALESGYHPSEIPMLAKCFALVKAAKGVSDEEAMAEALDPASQSRLLFSYGGRFTESAAGFRRGFELMEKFRTWREALYEAHEAGRRDTPTLLNTQQRFFSSRVGLERFVLEEVAANLAHDIYEEDPDKLFAIENNKAMRIVGLGYFDANFGTLMGIPVEKREFLCDVQDVINGPLPRTQAEKEAHGKNLEYEAIFLARAIKHWDELEALRAEGRLDRPHVLQVLYGDLGLPPNATNEQIEAAFEAKFDQFEFGVSLSIQFLMNASGETFDACRDAVQTGRLLPNAPYISITSPSLDEVNGTEGARKTHIGDLHRASGSQRLSDGAPVLTEADIRYVVNFPDNTTLASKTGLDSNPEVMAANNAIADKVERLCGRVHDRQLAAVYYALSQSAATPLKGAVFHAHGVTSTEHMALTFTLSKDNETGAVTVRYSEPNGFHDSAGRPLHFHWTATVALDGTVTSTPMVIELGQQPANP